MLIDVRVDGKNVGAVERLDAVREDRDKASGRCSRVRIDADKADDFFVFGHSNPSFQTVPFSIVITEATEEGTRITEFSELRITKRCTRHATEDFVIIEPLEWEGVRAEGRRNDQT